MQSSGFYVFIPVFNEESNLPIIESNIRKSLKALKDVKFLISDNCSTDNTVQGLETLRDRYPNVVTIHRQPKNVGFSRNMLAVEVLPDDRKIILLGANDIFHTPGLRKLAAILETYPTADLLIFNWAYVAMDGRGKISLLGPGDIKHFFTVDNLEDYLTRQPFFPNGIMQWVASRSILIRMAAHVDTMSPHIGAFMDAFPCQCVVVPDPPLALVKLAEDRGWRSSRDSIVNTHLQHVELVSRLLRNALKQAHISHATYKQVGMTHLKAVRNLPQMGWGHARASLIEQVSWRVRIFSRTFDINLRYQYERLSEFVYGYFLRHVVSNFREAGRCVRRRARMMVRGLCACIATGRNRFSGRG